GRGRPLVPACRTDPKDRACRAIEPTIRSCRDVKLPEPPLLLVTDRRQARWPLVEIVARAITGGRRWISVREKDLSEGEQIALVRTLLPIAHIPPLARIANALRVLGTIPGIQLAHAGRKASSQRPWHGMDALTSADAQTRNERPWPTVAPVAEA